MDLTVSEVLSRAADLIEPEGKWTRGVYVGPDRNCWCVLGAIQRAGNFGHDDNRPVAFLKDLMGVAWLHEWNDDPNRTQAEVVAKLREGAALARELGL
ncbi:MAG: hypothetical protein J7500_15600 [Sphingomonas sp.]|uniref:DUF6197 family protein n=1 Tax=Sphingomonas sp. TaxID=28214 RepID=UPI001B275E7F|nr:hypothetical protein [Sphingomonas sp.]MBO9624132.1 hypothetical protein [Sphingomonas sp.]